MDDLLAEAKGDDLPHSGSAVAAAADLEEQLSPKSLLEEQRDHSVNVDLLVPDDAELSISIADFAPRDSVLFYVVETNTTLGHFSKRSMKVKRKYEDFQWLYDRFSENSDLAGSIIPHLPVSISREQEKQAAELLAHKKEGVAQLTEDIKKRASQLEKFLRRIVQIASLRIDTNLQAFLEYDELLTRKSQGWFNFSGAVSPKIDTDETFEKMRNSNLVYQKSITSSLGAYTRLARSARGVADAYEAMPGVLEGLQRLDPDSEWKRSLDVFAKAFRGAKTNLNDRVTSENNILGDLLNDYTGQCGAVAAMHNRRLALLQRSINAKQQRLKLEPKAQTNPAKQDELKLLVSAEDDALQAFTTASATACTEVVRCRNVRVAEFRQALVTLAEEELETASKEIAFWEKTLEELRSL